jgi:hypothetical protein
MAYHRRAPRQTPERDTAERETLTGSAITGITMIITGPAPPGAALDCIGIVTALRDEIAPQTAWEPRPCAG